MRIYASRDRVYRLSPLAVHDQAVATAAALILFECTRDTIAYELRLQHGFTRTQAARVIREAYARVRPQ